MNLYSRTTARHLLEDLPERMQKQFTQCLKALVLEEINNVVAYTEDGAAGPFLDGLFDLTLEVFCYRHRDEIESHFAERNAAVFG